MRIEKEIKEGKSEIGKEENTKAKYYNKEKVVRVLFRKPSANSQTTNLTNELASSLGLGRTTMRM